MNRVHLIVAQNTWPVLPQPWAIKDPRLVKTLGRWHPFLAPYKARVGVGDSRP